MNSNSALKYCGHTFTILVFALISQVCAQFSSLIVVHSPDAIRFSPSNGNALRVSQLADVIRVATGQTASEPLEWQGVSIADVFSLPKASLVLRIADAIGDDIFGQHFGLVEDERHRVDEQFDSLAKSSSQRFNSPLIAKMDNKLGNTFSDDTVRLNFDALNRSNSFRSSVTKTLPNSLASNSDREDVRDLVEEVVSTRAFVDAIRRAKESRKESDWPSMSTLWVEMRAKSGRESEEEVKNAIAKVRHELIQQTVTEMRKLFADEIVIMIVADGDDNQMPIRIRRNVPYESNENRSLGLAHDFDVEFAPAFAMFSFTVALIALTSFALAVAMWNIDPGRDSIIYRMTAQRVKKEQ